MYGDARPVIRPASAGVACGEVRLRSPGSRAPTVPDRPAATDDHDLATVFVDDEPTVTTDPTPPGPQPAMPGEGRYAWLGRIGTGGMGEVHRVLDTRLNRVVAMKVIRADRLDHRSVVQRFVEEAQATAQLEHPGIVPVHDLGRLPDGRWFFSMKEVKGRTLGQVARDVHRASRDGRWGVTEDGFGLHRLIDAFRKVCEAVAYAHARGVVHRDLKPDNILVGAYGEVLVVDWGLAKVLGAASRDEDSQPPVVTHRDRRRETSPGAVAGTPAYMAPEQARGDNDRVGPPADVYALGGVLHELLFGRDDEPAPADLAAPPALVEIVERARAEAPEHRWPDAGALAAEVAAWLEGARRREQAQEHLDIARTLMPEVEALQARIAGLRGEADRLLEQIPPQAPIERKRPAWAMQDEAERLAKEVVLRRVEITQQLRAAIAQAPDLEEAHAALADHYQRRHAEAEQRRDAAAAAQYEALLRAHAGPRHAAWLEGRGRLCLVTDPPGAEVRCYRYEQRDRRLVAVFDRALGRTPLRDVPLPIGSWLLEIRARGHAPVRYPVSIEREARWDGVPPGASEPLPIRLPRPDELGPDDVYVPAGPAWVGGDPEAIGALPRRRVWVDGFVIRRFPVARAAFVVFLNDLVARGRATEAERHAPDGTSTDAGTTGALALRRDADGRYALPPDWRPTQPMNLVDWFAARAYSRWEAEQSGLPWRLCGDVEWEKAARGADGRFFPWGDHLDATFCCYMTSHLGIPALPDLDTWPLDESPYGVRGLGGGVRDWCESVYHRYGAPIVDGRMLEDPEDTRPDVPRIVRGGSWSHHERLVRAATRWWETPTARWEAGGFRLCRPFG